MQLTRESLLARTRRTSAAPALKLVISRRRRPLLR